jgi:hypothetical protein
MYSTSPFNHPLAERITFICKKMFTTNYKSLSKQNKQEYFYVFNNPIRQIKNLLKNIPIDDYYTWFLHRYVRNLLKIANKQLNRITRELHNGNSLVNSNTTIA